MSSNTRKGTPKSKSPFSHDYGIPGIPPRFYKPVAVISGGIGGAGAWWLMAHVALYEQWFYTLPVAFVLTCFVTLGISQASVGVQRIHHWFSRH